MLDARGATGSVTHYTPYETRVLDGLVEALPDLADRIRAVEARMLDVEPIIKANTKHPNACGRTSIKYVLPAWCPDMSYADLGIRDGQTASVRYLKAVRGLVSRMRRGGRSLTSSSTAGWIRSRWSTCSRRLGGRPHSAFALNVA